MEIEIVFATPQRSWRWSVALPEVASVADALAAAPLEQAGLDRTALPSGVGVFGREVMLEHLLRPGDRVEIYRPLLCDPKVVRRERAEREQLTRPRSRQIRKPQR
jgi:putative ubiquitin-RnfH superfamily antitoxin RatB of RatAB toxin-antitoxin module